MLKLYCSKCHGFMKDLLPNQAAALSGTEVCKECGEIGRNTLSDYTAAYQKVKQQLDSTYNRGVVELEKVIQGVFDS